MKPRAGREERGLGGRLIIESLQRATGRTPMAGQSWRGSPRDETSSQIRGMRPQRAGHMSGERRPWTLWARPRRESSLRPDEGSPWFGTRRVVPRPKRHSRSYGPPDSARGQTIYPQGLGGSRARVTVG